MKIYTITSIALFILIFSSCKKSYDCTCITKKTSENYKVILSDWQTFVDANNSTNSLNQTDEYNENVYSMEKTSKASANAACGSSVDKDYVEKPDDTDKNTNGNYDEPAYSITTEYTTECNLEKQ